MVLLLLFFKMGEIVTCLYNDENDLVNRAT